MERVAFTMKLFPGREKEYRDRHENLWPKLEELLKSVGVSEYSIFLDEKTNLLFGFLKIPNSNSLLTLRESPVMWEWWQSMKDLMETNADASPVTNDLKEVFYLE
jgi:L-rhamnose mutarotase